MSFARPSGVTLVSLLAGLTVVLAACSSAPTPAKPTAAPAAPTTAPAAKPTDAPKAAKPAAEAPKPAAEAPKPAAKAAFDQAKIAEMFSGKTIDLYIGYAPGGGYDIRGRIFAEFFSKHMPGNPKMAVQNMAGGGGLQATRHVMRAKPDGLTMVTIPSGIFLLDLLGEKQEGFDRNQPKMLGNYEVAADAYTPLWVRTELGTTWEEVVKRGVELKYGAPAVGNSQALAGEWLSIVGQPVKVVYGYGGSNELLAAVDRKEVDLASVDDLNENPEAAMPRSRQAFPEWFTTNPKYITPILATRSPIPQAWATPFGWTTPPQILDVVPATELQKDAYKLAFAVREAVDPLSLPPGVPDDVFAALQKAMVDTCNDPEFKKAMKDRTFDGGYRSPEEIQTTLEKLASSPKEVVDILRRMYIGN
jgi:tripartite-type tricarboxylate transporter receptor subunit TctC